MASEWKVSEEKQIGVKTLYSVYRYKDGYKETRGFWESKADAERLAKTLNEEAKR